LSASTGSVYRIDQVVVACVEQVFHFGAFVRLPDGTQAYVRKRELTQAGNLDPRQVISAGDEIEAVVTALAEPGRKMELSVRRAEQDPWEAFGQSHQVQDTLAAEVKRLSARGALVQVSPGVDGFIPLAELAPWQVDKPHDLLWLGDHVDAMITRLDPGSKRMRLSVRRQMGHQARVKAVMATLSEREGAEAAPPDEEPRVSLTEQEAEPIAEGEEGVGPDVAERVGWILVVDDHDEVREPLVTWLRQRGFWAAGARATEQALAFLRERDYGLALIGLNMPGENGLDLIEAVERVAPDTRVAVMSAPEWVAQRAAELAALGVIDAFIKPLDLDDVYEALTRLGQGEAPDPAWPALSRPTEKSVQSSFQRLVETTRSGLSLTMRFETGLRELVDMTQAEEGLVFHLDPESQQVSIVAQVGERALNREATYALGESPVRDVIWEGRAVFETCVSSHARGRFQKLLALLPFESCIGVAIPAGGEVQHALFLFHSREDAFSLYRLRDAQAMAVLFSVALESQALERRIRAVSPFLLSGQLSAGLGHEVYNQMSGLEIQLLNLQGDLERLKPGGTPSGWVEIDRGMGQLLELARDLKRAVTLFRELTRAEQEDEVDVNEVVQRARSLLRPVADQQRVRIELDLAPGLPPVAGSAIRLQQVFVNLMLNAVQQTAPKMAQWPKGRGLLQVSTACQAEGERPLRVRFCDNGPGIHRQLWETIFALGFSTRPAGTGLGLFIARSLMESMGGQVVVERSVIPMGTTFRVELPA